MERIKASIILGSYLDTLGFYNGTWEFNFNLKIKNLMDCISVNYSIIHQFFAMGGFNMDISQWNSSDDTIMMIATIKACKKGGTIENFKKEYIKILPMLEKSKRGAGITTLISLRNLAKNKNILYSDKMGGNGAAMRTSYIGIYFKDNIEKLLEISILSSRLTHNYPLGFLGGMVTALFTSYAINNIEPWKWCDMLLDINMNGKLDKVLKKMPNYTEYLKDKDEFWNSWYKYKEYRMNKFDIKSSDFIHGIDRINDLIKILYTMKDINSGNINYDKFGSTGASATIIAYDCILMSITNKGGGDSALNLDNISYNWESLVIFSALHFGDNDTIGTIAGNWYGALRGFEGVKSNIVDQLEFKKEIITLV